MKSVSRCVALLCLAALALLAPSSEVLGQSNVQPSGSGAGGDVVGTLPQTVASVEQVGELLIVTMKDGRVGVVSASSPVAALINPAPQGHTGTPDGTLTWKCRAGTMTRNCWMEPGEDKHAMDVRFFHEIEQCQAIDLFAPIG